MTLGAVLSSLFAVVIALAVVLGLAWVLLKALRKWQDRYSGAEEGAERPIRFLRAMPLGQTERVVLVEVRGEAMLLGVTAGGISLLARWPEDVPPPPLQTVWPEAKR